ncbi:MAG: hypothetical protein WEK74_16570 [Hydrogenophaga sp.]
MRMMLGLIGVLLTMLVVAQLVKTQTATEVPAPVQPPQSAPDGTTLPVLQGNPQQVQEQVQQALDAALKAGQQRMDAAEKP